MYTISSPLVCIRDVASLRIVHVLLSHRGVSGKVVWMWF
jgi:hypothetical protein